MAVCGFGCKKSLSRVITQMVLENSHPPHRAPISFQVEIYIISWLALPKNLDHKCAQNDRVQLYVQPGAGRPICIGFGYQLNIQACALSMLSIHSPDYVFTVLVSIFMIIRNHF